MWKKDYKNLLLVTAGEPSSIGSEIIIKALKDLKSPKKVVVIGEKSAFEPFTSKINVIKDFSDYQEGNINLINVGYIKKVTFGKPSKTTALSAIRSLEIAIELIKRHNISALVTAPIYKKGIIELKEYKNFTGHTEFFAEAFKSRVLMMFYGKNLKVATVTTHIPLKSVIANLKPDRIKEAIEISYWSLKRLFKIKAPRISLLGLNPHAGEEGAIGKEEIEILTPIVKSLRKRGIDLFGPSPADTALYKAYNGEYDLVLGLYHDQILPTFKTLYFNSGVNVTLGLPIVRTSPDHGTAFDIAGKGIADERSFKNALKLAIGLVKNLQKGHVNED